MKPRASNQYFTFESNNDYDVNDVVNAITKW